MHDIYEWFLSFCLWLLVFTAPANEAFGAVLLLVALDLVVGVWAAKVVRKERIVSWKLRHTLTRKLLPYFVAITCALYLEREFFTIIPLMKIIAGFAAASEARSVYERLGEITGLDFWSVLRDRIQPATKDETKQDE